LPSRFGEACSIRSARASVGLRKAFSAEIRCSASRNLSSEGLRVGYVYVPIELADVGSEVEVVWPFDGPVKARVAELPFIDPKKDIPKA
jgi:hypothetical protein